MQQSRFRWQLFVASANGTSPRPIATSTSIFRAAAWAPDGRRIAYTDDTLHVVRPDGSRNTAVPVTGVPGRPTDVQWSPDGRYLASGWQGTIVVLRAGDLRASRTIAGDAYAWSRSGRWLAVRDGERVFVVRPDGSGRRALAADASYGPLAWSVADRYVAFARGERVAVVGSGGRAVRELPGRTFAWSPTRPELAVATDAALLLVRAGGGASAVLAREPADDPAWAPDGGSVAYLACGVCGSPFWADRSLRVASRAGAVRTVVAATGIAGGSIAQPVWTRSPPTRYRPVEPRRLATVVADGIHAPRPIDLVAADGDRIAYASCGHVFLWTPATGRVIEVGSSSLEPRCSSPDYYAGFGLTQLALAGDRAASTWIGGGNTTSWWLAATRVATGATLTLGQGSATTGGPYVPWRGAIAALPTGAGNLLAFSTWTEARDPGSTRIRTTAQAVRVAPAGGCPCPQIASSPGPLVPYDVADDRIVAGGDNETIVYDAGGTILRSVVVSPSAAQLDGQSLVIAVRGELRQIDVASGALLQRWSLPDVPASPRCERFACWRATSGRLVVDDAARGLLAYALDGDVHVVRLADGTDTTVARGTAARFTSAGLVVLEGSNLRLLPFGRLPQP